MLGSSVISIDELLYEDRESSAVKLGLLIAFQVWKIFFSIRTIVVSFGTWDQNMQSGATLKLKNV